MEIRKETAFGAVRYVLARTSHNAIRVVRCSCSYRIDYQNVLKTAGRANLRNSEGEEK
jgi:hypothetical protein